ncbi:MAG: arylamine N-acetyltransferase [Alphaproteobacteria bacterium]|nr:arylamine N-acetyltransferase [Alphaproteobacteria bacterium]
MNLSAYLSRVGFDATPRPDIATLRALHRAHLEAIPYENLDVQLGAPTTPDPAAAFAKIVTRRRGGWCYEMNGVFGTALEAIGFKVTRLAGAVMREFAGDGQIGNHLVLIVDLDEPWLADVGFGDGLVEAVPLKDAAIRQSVFDFRLEDMRDGWWRLHNHAEGGARSFDFNLAVRDEARLAERCAFLQTDPSSLFMRNGVIQRHGNGAMAMLVNKVLKRVTPAGVTREEIPDAGAYTRTLREVFDLDAPEAATLWPRIVERHDAMLAAQAAAG